MTLEQPNDAKGQALIGPSAAEAAEIAAAAAAAAIGSSKLTIAKKVRACDEARV